MNKSHTDFEIIEGFLKTPKEVLISLNKKYAEYEDIIKDTTNPEWGLTTIPRGTTLG